MKEILYILAVFTLVSCQQNPQNTNPTTSNAPPPEATEATTATNAPENDWSRRNLKGRVKVLTEIPSLSRYYFNEQGFITRYEQLKTLEEDTAPLSYITYRYNDRNQLVEEIWGTNEPTHTTQYQYNDHGDITLKEHLFNKTGDVVKKEVYTYTYSPEGKKITETNGNYKTVLYQNAQKKLLKRERYRDEVCNYRSIFEYNNEGLLVKETNSYLEDDDEGEKWVTTYTTYTYNQQGKLAESNEVDSNGNLLQSIAYQYDPAGKLLKKKVVTPDGKIPVCQYTYTYDAQGNPTAERYYEEETEQTRDKEYQIVYF